MNSAGFVNTDDDAGDDARWVHTQHQTIYASPLPLRARYTVHIYGAVQWQLWNDLDNFDWRLLFLIVVLLRWVRSISHLQIVNYKFDTKVDCFNIRNYYEKPHLFLWVEPRQVNFDWQLPGCQSVKKKRSNSGDSAARQERFTVVINSRWRVENTKPQHDSSLVNLFVLFYYFIF